MSELDTLILLSAELELIKQSHAEVYLEKLDIIGKLIYGLIKKLESEK